MTDFGEIKGQEHAKRAIEIAVTGGHSVLMTGPPGHGKTMLILALDGLTDKDITVYDDIPYIENGATLAKQDMDKGEQVFITMNPCLCGYLGDSTHVCSCDVEMVHRYRVTHTPGSIRDRISIYIEVPAIRFREMSSVRKGEASAVVRKRIDAGVKLLPKVKSTTDESALRLLEAAVDRLGCSTRQYVNILTVARTIAALDGATTVEVRHIAEAIQYRGN